MAELMAFRRHGLGDSRGSMCQRAKNGMAIATSIRGRELWNEQKIAAISITSAIAALGKGEGK
jgi:hypothetical protein